MRVPLHEMAEGWLAESGRTPLPSVAAILADACMRQPPSSAPSPSPSLASPPSRPFPAPSTNADLLGLMEASATPVPMPPMPPSPGQSSTNNHAVDAFGLTPFGAAPAAASARSGSTTTAVAEGATSTASAFDGLTALAPVMPMVGTHRLAGPATDPFAGL